MDHGLCMDYSYGLGMRDYRHDDEETILLRTYTTRRVRAVLARSPRFNPSTAPVSQPVRLAPECMRTRKIRTKKNTSRKIIQLHDVEVMHLG